MLNICPPGTLQLSDNEFSGTLSTEIGLVTEIERIRLDQNNLSGSIPTEIGLLDNLRILSLAQNNQVKGFIPTEMGNCRLLSEFVTRQCVLTHYLQSHSSLTILRYSSTSNQLVGGPYTF
jgi:Leucine-rich repeat (LRR) protein